MLPLDVNVSYSTSQANQSPSSTPIPSPKSSPKKEAESCTQRVISLAKRCCTFNFMKEKAAGCLKARAKPWLPPTALENEKAGLGEQINALQQKKANLEKLMQHHRNKESLLKSLISAHPKNSDGTRSKLHTLTCHKHKLSAELEKCAKDLDDLQLRQNYFGKMEKEHLTGQLVSAATQVASTAATLANIADPGIGLGVGIVTTALTSHLGVRDAEAASKEIKDKDFGEKMVANARCRTWSRIACTVASVAFGYFVKPYLLQAARNLTGTGV